MKSRRSENAPFSNKTDEFTNQKAKPRPNQQVEDLKKQVRDLEQECDFLKDKNDDLQSWVTLLVNSMQDSLQGMMQ